MKNDDVAQRAIKTPEPSEVFDDTVFLKGLRMEHAKTREAAVAKLDGAVEDAEASDGADTKGARR